MLSFSDKCQCVINHCDCCGIENLIVSNSSWDDEDYFDVELQTLKQLALKFTNLKLLKLHFELVLNYDLLSFWTLLRLIPIIKKNNSKVEIISHAWKKLMEVIINNGR